MMADVEILGDANSSCGDETPVAVPAHADSKRRSGFAHAFFNVISNPIVAWSFLVALLGIEAIIRAGSLLNHDTAWFLYGTGQMLDGAVLYRDIIEINPPLAFYLCLPPVLVARWLHVLDVDAFKAYCFALCLLSLAVSAKLLKFDPKIEPASRRALIVSCAIAVFVLPGGDFGQREHLLVVFTLPYVILVALRRGKLAPNPWFTSTIGLIAMLGFALKPYFLITSFLLECYLALSLKSVRQLVRPETIALAAAGAVYAVSIFVMNPDYLTTIVPYARALYGPVGQSAWVILLRVEILALPLCMLVHVTTRKASAISAIGDVFGISALAMAISYLYQMKGWAYQAYPLAAFLLLLCAAVVFAKAKTEQEPITRPAGPPPSRMLQFATLLVACLLTGNAAARANYPRTMVDGLTRFVRNEQNVRSIAIFASTVSSGFPLVNTLSIRWASHFDTFWMLPAIAAHQARSKVASDIPDQVVFADLEAMIRRNVLSDLEKYRPELVFVDTKPVKEYFGDMDFDYIRFFSSDTRFAAYWSQYEPVGAWGGFQVFRRRRDDAATAPRT